MNANDTIVDIGAVELRNRLANGALKATDVAKACVARIKHDDVTNAVFAWHDPHFVLQQGERLDSYRQTGRPLGPLHGIPVALCDVIDTARIPSENGTAIDRGRIPQKDAAVVERLKAAGAVIIGKTVTSDLACPPGDAGKASSGAARAVAAGLVSLSLATDTIGTIMQQASWCGTVGFNPTFGSVSRRGTLQRAGSLDRIGVFARSVEDAAMGAEILFGHDPADRATTTMPHPRLFETAQQKAPVLPAFAFVRTPFWTRADDITQAAFGELVETLGEPCFEVELPDAFAEADKIGQRIHYAEMAKACYHYAQRGREQLPPALLAAIDKGNTILARDYLSALDWPAIFSAGLDEIFTRCDAILTPAAVAPPSTGRDTANDPAFNVIWSLCGLPTVSLPLLAADNDMPIGVQLVGRPMDDARLLRTARWLTNHIASLS